jgi:membrane carboxypeptidase/penicillin-binding protein
LRETPVEQFKPPEGVSLIRVNIETGLPSDGGSGQTVWEAFVDGTQPFDRTGREKNGASPENPLKPRPIL